jgi:hypothetical protein
MYDVLDPAVDAVDASTRTVCPWAAALATAVAKIVANARATP